MLNSIGLNSIIDDNGLSVTKFFIWGGWGLIKGFDSSEGKV